MVEGLLNANSVILTIRPRNSSVLHVIFLAHFDEGFFALTFPSPDYTPTGARPTECPLSGAATSSGRGRLAPKASAWLCSATSMLQVRIR